MKAFDGGGQMLGNFGLPPPPPAAALRLSARPSEREQPAVVMLMEPEGVFVRLASLTPPAGGWGALPVFGSGVEEQAGLLKPVQNSLI